MSKVTIEHSLCRKDHLCVQECPAKCITIDGDGFPVSDPERQQNCIDCGHCLAVCPYDALTLNNVSAVSQPKVNRKKLEWSAVENLIKSRRSVRSYKNQPIAPELINKLLDCTRWAPTGGNSQLVSWLFVENKDTMKKISAAVAEWAGTNENLIHLLEVWNSGYDIILRGAPHLAIAYAGNQYGSTPADCIIAATTLELAASSQGVGACWAGFFMMACSAGYKPLMDLLNLPVDNNIYAALMIGYPQYGYNRIPQRKELRVQKL